MPKHLSAFQTKPCTSSSTNLQAEGSLETPLVTVKRVGWGTSPSMSINPSLAIQHCSGIFSKETAWAIALLFQWQSSYQEGGPEPEKKASLHLQSSTRVIPTKCWEHVSQSSSFLAQHTDLTHTLFPSSDWPCIKRSEHQNFTTYPLFFGGRKRLTIPI